jgi:type 1 glutamine amidotransferase
MNRFKLFIALFAIQLAVVCTAMAQKQFKVLVVTTTRGFHHESVHAGYLALQELGVKHNFDVVLLQAPDSFNDDNLKQFQAIVFLNTTGDIFDDKQQKAMEHFIEAGKGFVGIHSASDTEYDWDWYTKLVGRMFHIHPAIQTARLKLTNNKFPGLQGFEGDRLWTDEWYEFGPEKTTGLNYILAVDESSYNPKADWGARGKGEGMGKFHPIAWYHEYDGGRAFYTALGHMPTDFNDPDFLNHIYAGIFWAATGKK